MSSPNLKRRKFLKNAALWGGSATMLTSCTSLDSLFLADKRSFEKEVFIIGAGAAGLMAAHTLKKNRIPFRLFEASHRPGGRLYSLVSSDGTTLEMGADSFESHHRLVFELLKEFQIEWTESVFDPTGMPLWRSAQGESLTDQEYQKISAHLIEKMIQNRVQTFGSSDQYKILSPVLAQELDSLSMAQYLRVNWIQPDERVVQFWDAWARAHYSSNPDRVSSLRWIWDQSVERKTRSLYKIKGGWESLNKVLFERIAGVIPDHLVRLRWALDGIRKTEEGYRCVFKTPKGTEVLETQNLILAMPVNQYRKINGFTDLPLPKERIQAIKNLALGEGSKAFVSYKPGTIDTMEKSYLRNQVLMTYLKTQNVDWVGGLRGGAQSHWTLPDIENWRTSLIANPAGSKEGQFDYHVINWKDRPFIQGARSQWGPGQWGAYALTFETGDFDGSLQWAGEYVPSSEKGTVHAALLSGQTAALRMVERLKTA